MYSNSKLAETLQYRDKYECNDGFVEDVFDSKNYRRMRQENVTVNGERLIHTFFSSPNDIVLGIAAGGVCAFKNRKESCWPIILVNYNRLPSKHYCLEDLLSIGVVPGPHQPKDMDSFLWPLIEEMKKLMCGVLAWDAMRKVNFYLHAYLILAFGDMPAVAKLMRIKGHNGKLPCRACKIDGVRIPSGKTHYNPFAGLTAQLTTPPISRSVTTKA